MTWTTLLLSLLFLASLACQQPTGDESADPAPAANSDSRVANETGPAVEYEPAYPDDVSSEELSESDVALQKKHSHGEGPEHSHDAEEGQNGHQH